MKSRKPLVGLLEQIEAENRGLIRKYRRELRGLPQGALVVNAQPKGTVLYEFRDGTSRGITRDLKRVQGLARAQILREKIEDLEELADGIVLIRRKTDGGDPYELARILSEKGIPAEKILWTPEQQRMAFRQSENHYREEEKVYATDKGILMRSKSEMFWGNMYEELMIPYAYEKKITLDVTGMPDVKGAWEHNGRLYKDYYPDFVILLADGSIIIHEHLGRIDSAEYREKTAERIFAMTSSGFITPSRLILTYEDDVRDPSAFRGTLGRIVRPFA